MGYELKLCPEELIMLGDLMDASYIDYSYVAAMHEIGKNYSKIRDKTLQNLARNRVLSRKLSGEMTVQPAAAALLRNLFEGTAVAALEICVPGDPGTLDSIRYHFGKESVTEVISEGESFLLRSTDAEAIRKCVAEAAGSHSTPSPELTSIGPARVTRMLRASRSVVEEGHADVEVYETEGALYRIGGDGIPVALTDAEAVSLLLNTILGGVEYV